MSSLQMDILSWVAVAVAVGFGGMLLALGGMFLGVMVECWRNPEAASPFPIVTPPIAWPPFVTTAGGS